MIVALIYHALFISNARAMRTLHIAKIVQGE